MAGSLLDAAVRRYDRFDPGQPGRLLRERWKYTPLVGLTQEYEAQAPRGQPSAPSALRLTHCRTGADPLATDNPVAQPVSGLDPSSNAARRFVSLLAPDAHWEAYPLADALLSNPQNGWLLTLPREQRSEVRIDLGDGRAFGMLQILPGARVELDLNIIARSRSFGVLLLDIGVGATLDYQCRALDCAGTGWLLTKVAMAEHAQLQARQYYAGAGNQRHETHVQMAGRGASATLTGASLVATGQRFDQQITVEHLEPQATSEQQFHCVAQADARSTFNGRIHIHPHAHGTVAQLNNRNLALAPSAQINTKPELEIYNDDVRCAHGATVGQLDQDALFYCQARGIDPVAAQRLLTTAFLARCVGGRHADAVRAAFDALLCQPAESPS